MKWNPSDYASYSAGQLVWAAELLAKLSLTGNESVLDVGCGDGKITATIARSLPQGAVVGIDQSAEMIAFANAQYPSAQFPNLTFLTMDARQINVDRTFDVVFSNATLHWVDDHLAVLQGISRHLHDGGRVIISCGGQGNAADVIATFQQVAQQAHWRDYFRDFNPPYYFYGPDDYTPWLAAAGLTAQRLALVPKDMQHSSVAAFTGWLRTTWFPYSQRVPADQQTTFVSEVVKAYLADHASDADGTVHVAMVRLEVDAHKARSR